MKTKSTLLLIIAALGALPVAGHAQLGSDAEDLGFIINAPMPPLDHPIHPGAPQPVLVPNHPSPTALPPVHLNVQAASTFLAQVVSSLPADGTLRLSDLFMNPEFFAAAHAAGPEADALRGQIDWLMLTGVILGLDGDDGLDDFDGMDGSDDLRGSDDPDEIFGESSNGIILGGPGNDTLAPFTPSIILGGPGNDTIILGGPGNDTLAPFNLSIILGGPGTDTIILGGNGFRADTTLPSAFRADTTLPSGFRADTTLPSAFRADTTLPSGFRADTTLP